MKPTAFRVATLLLSAIAAWLSAGSFAARAADEPLFRVGDKNYTMLDLTGLTEAQLRQRFRDETKGMTVKDLTVYLFDEEMAALDKLPERDRQHAGEEMVWISAQKPLLRACLEHIVLAGIADNIFKDQGVDPAEYFDMEAARKWVRKQRRYIDLLATAPDSKDKDEALLDELNQSLGLHFPKKEWTDSRDITRRFLPLNRWGGLRCRGPSYEDYAVKVLLVHDLVKDVCTKGSYHRKGVELAIIHDSLAVAYEVEGYNGDKAALEGFLRSVSKDGVILERGVGDLMDSLRAVSPSITFKVSLKAGWELINENIQTQVGQVVETRPGCYRIMG